jgi:hypothetical protein
VKKYFFVFTATAMSVRFKSSQTVIAAWWI